jgi:hypothetical protein
MTIFISMSRLYRQIAHWFIKQKSKWQLTV